LELFQRIAAGRPVVGRQPIGGARMSCTHQNAGNLLNLLR